ncbi:multiple sugar transport system permease protein [Streptomyces sp. Amel2xB2]|uniref:carbohydrate ABC transporter permease n=1 Tax=Streptomyces sp. Amel2xB2 TaxID=1305829 RepID=UPI000DB919EC|nr:carbohydrate ABC transporter permease [Streptomyces sp. Amel2xB2]RAJ66749.1 multiple sugar transport system permease protein [Streptomyces sp. Amel2xB2]
MAALTPAPAATARSTADSAPRRSPRTDSERLFNRVTLGTLLALALLWLAPLAWAVATSVRPPGELATDPTAWFSGHSTLANYREVLAAGRIPYWYVNSFVTSGLTTLLTVCTASLAAFALSRLRFRHRRPVFLLILAGVMIPPQLLMVPHFLTLQAAGMLNTYWAVVLPQVPNVVAVFVFKQFFDGIPVELTDAARADGASWLRIYGQIVMPLSRPAVSAVTIFVFVWSWNNFLWPLLAVTDPQMMTLPVGLTSVQDAFGLPQAQLMASAVLGALPLLTVFLFFQRRIVEGIAGTGLK